jgi:hypothetical protein
MVYPRAGTQHPILETVHIRHSASISLPHPLSDIKPSISTPDLETLKRQDAEPNLRWTDTTALSSEPARRCLPSLLRERADYSHTQGEGLHI